MSPAIEATVWIAAAAHALARRWPHVPPTQLEDVAAELYAVDWLGAMAPADAVALWLRPLPSIPVARPLQEATPPLRRPLPPDRQVV